MKTFAEASKVAVTNIENTLNAAAIQQSTPAHGSTSGDGKMTTAAQGQSHATASTSGQKLSLAEKTQISLKNDPEGKSRLNETLLMAFDALGTYGKEPEQLESVKKLMHFALADYPWSRTREAFAHYFKYNKGFPEPSDIVQIIERGNKPAFDRAVYTTLSKKPPEHRTTAEWQYMRDYEDWMVG